MAPDLGAKYICTYGIDGNNIVGYYWIKSDAGPSVAHGFFATPVPLAPTMLLLASGLIGLARLMKKFKK